MLKVVGILMVGAIAVAPVLNDGGSTAIQVDCNRPGALEKALIRAEKLTDPLIVLDGVCEGGIVLDQEGLTLIGATQDSGLMLTGPSPIARRMVEVSAPGVALRNMTLRGGEFGVYASGAGAEVLLYRVETVDVLLPVNAEQGASVRLLEANLRDGLTGMSARSGGSLNATDSTVRGFDLAVSGSESSVALSDCIVEDNRGAGVLVNRRSDLIVFGGEFHRNGEVHIAADNRSDVTLLNNPTIGSAADETLFSLSGNEDSKLSTFSTAEIYGSISALDRVSLRLGVTTVHGAIYLSLFSDGQIRDAEITDGVICSDASDLISRQLTTPFVLDCPSSSSGSSSPTNPTSTTSPDESADPARSVERPPHPEFKPIDR